MFPDSSPKVIENKTYSPKFFPRLDPEKGFDVRDLVLKANARTKKWLAYSVVFGSFAVLAIAGIMIGLYMSGNLHKEAQKLPQAEENIGGRGDALTGQSLGGGAGTRRLDGTLADQSGAIPTTVPTPFIDRAVLLAANELDVFDNVGEAVGDMAENVADVASDVVENVADTHSNFVENAVDAMDNVQDSLSDAVENIVPDLSMDDVNDGVSDLMDTLTDNAEDIREDISEAISDALEPSKDVSDVVEEVLDELNDGVKDSIDDLTDGFGDKLEDVLDDLLYDTDDKNDDDDSDDDNDDDNNTDDLNDDQSDDDDKTNDVDDKDNDDDDHNNDDNNDDNYTDSDDFNTITDLIDDFIDVSNSLDDGFSDGWEVDNEIGEGIFGDSDGSASELRDNIEDIADNADDTLSNVFKNLGDAVESISDNTGDMIDTLRDMTGDAASAMSDGFENAADAFEEVGDDMTEGHAIMSMLSNMNAAGLPRANAAENIMSGFGLLGNGRMLLNDNLNPGGLPGMGSSLAGALAFSNNGEDVIENMQDISSKALNAHADILDNMKLDDIVDVHDSIGDSLGNMHDIDTPITGLHDDIFDKSRDTLADIAESIPEPDVGDFVSDAFGDRLYDSRDVVDDVFENVRDNWNIFENPIEGAASSVSDNLDNASDTFDDTADVIKDSVDSVLDNGYHFSMSGESGFSSRFGRIVTDSAPSFDTRDAPDFSLPQSNGFTFSFPSQTNDNEDD